MALTCATIAEKYSSLLSHVAGDLHTPISGLSSPQLATAESLIFVSDRKHLKIAENCPAKSWVVAQKLASLLPQGQPGQRVIFLSKNPYLAMALIGRAFFAPQLNRQPFGGEKVHPSAVISSSARLGKDVLIGPHTTIGDDVEIGDGCVIGANTTIEAQAKIGPRSHIHAQVYIAYQCEIGADCEIHPQTSIGTEGFGYAHDELGQHFRLTHFGKVVIEDRVQIGAGVQVDRGTFGDSVIGSGTIIDNHCHLGHNIRVGKGTIMVGGVLVAGSVTIGDHCVFGGRTTIGGHLTIPSGSQFAALSAIPSSIEKPGQYGGYPPVPLKTSLKILSSLAQLPKMRRSLAQIMKKMNLEDPEDNISE